MKDRKGTLQPNKPTMKNRKHEERINDEKNNHMENCSFTSY